MLLAGLLGSVGQFQPQQRQTGASLQMAPRKGCFSVFITKSCPTLLQLTLWSVARQALSIGLPRQEYWSGLPFPSPGDLPDPGMEPLSPAMAGGFFTAEPPGKSLW